MAPTSWWQWFGFVGCVLAFLALDLGVFHRRARVERPKAALFWTLVWLALALLFALGLKSLRSPKVALEFLTGYFVEASLSIDNVFVISLIFAYFAVPAENQHRVLFWGILGALVMRGLLIGAGLTLVLYVDWVLYLFGGFLLLSGARMLFVRARIEPERNKIIQMVRRFCAVSPTFDGQRFTTIWNGRRALTPLALALLLVEVADLLFAVDSVPAVFAVTTKPFIVFTSNIFAILGLRSLYFVLAGAVRSFRYLNIGVPFVLVFFGIKMLMDPHNHPAHWFQAQISNGVSLLVVAAILLASIILSLTAKPEQGRFKALGS